MQETEKNRGENFIFAPLEKLGAQLPAENLVIITDSFLKKKYGPHFPAFPLIEVPRGEKAKNLKVLEGVYEELLKLNADRKASVLAIGGGTVSDLGGFAASTWLRGIDFGFVPTTLLAMVDAAVGGKNGIDFMGYKNMIGTITEPRFVFFDVDFLHTISDSEFASGMAEVIKHGILDTQAHFEFIEKITGTGGRSISAIRQSISHSDLEQLIKLSVSYKASVISQDLREAGLRRRLNLGHTIGHAIEVNTGLPHGYAVAAGLGCALRLSMHSEFGTVQLTHEHFVRINKLLKHWGLPTSIPEALTQAGLKDNAKIRTRIADAVTKDKKRSGERVHFIIVQAIGDVVEQSLPLEAIEKFIRSDK